jgi:hypothetical protein
LGWNFFRKEKEPIFTTLAPNCGQTLKKDSAKSQTVVTLPNLIGPKLPLVAGDDCCDAARQSCLSCRAQKLTIGSEHVAEPSSVSFSMAGDNVSLLSHLPNWVDLGD